MAVPTITEEDLVKFHQTHFAHTSLPLQFFSQPDSIQAGDGLGCYPDGVERTLTDEDVAYLREREIQTLLRENRRQESDSPLPEDAMSSGQLQHASPQKLSSASPSRGVTPTAPKHRRNTSSIEGSPQPANNQQHQVSVDNQRRKKRKKKCKNSWGAVSKYTKKEPDAEQSEEEYSYRRIARELDEVKDTPVEMDY